MSNRNFDSRTIVQRLQNQVYARNLYTNNTTGQTLINNPQTTDGNSSRFVSYHSGSQTEYYRGLMNGPDTVSLGGIFAIPPSPILFTVPTAPTNLLGVAADSSVTITFTQGSNGGTPITNYEYSINNGLTFIPCSPPVIVSPVIITGLTNGTTYYIKLKAVNTIGSSSASTALIVVPVTVPDAPIITSASNGNTRATINFTQGSNGGSPILNYYYSTDNGLSFSECNPEITTSPIVITGLTNGTTYQIMLKAINLIGLSNVSNSISATPFGSPNAPTNLIVTPGNTQVSIAFTQGFDGGSAIINYQYSIDNGASFIAFSPVDIASPVIITGLTNGTTYQIQLKAVTIAGASVASSTVSGTPFAQVITDGLVLYYNFADTASYPGTGASVNNLVTGNPTGVLTNGPIFSGAYEGLINVDGANDYIDTNGSYASESFTINAWFKTVTVGGTAYMIISKETPVGSPWNYRMFLSVTGNVGLLNCDIAPLGGGADSVANSINLADNIWHMGTFSRDALTNTLKVYVDGVLAQTKISTIAGSIINTQEVWIGLSAYASTDGYPFNGSIGSCFIYNRALTDAEVLSNYDVTKPRFLPGPGTLFLTPSTTVGTTTIVSSPFASGNSYSFNGTSNYLSVVTNDSWDFGLDDFTIEWFQFQTDSNLYPRIFAIGIIGASPPTTSIACSIEVSLGNIFYTWTGPPAAATSFLSVTPYKNAWVHFAIVRNSGVLRVYKNGVQQGSNSSNAKNISNSLPLYFGVEGGNTSVSLPQTYYGGLLTNIRFVKGLAVYTGPFTVPTSALTVTAAVNPYGGSNTQAIPSGYTKLLFVPADDKIVASLTTSLTDYNAAAVNDWVKITSTEWASLQTNVTGTLKAGATDTILTTSTSGGLNNSGAAFVSNSISTGFTTAILANQYLYGFAFKWNTAEGTADIAVYTNNSTTLTSGFNQVGSLLPNTSAFGVIYYVRKGVSSTNGSTSGLLSFFTGSKMNYSNPSFTGSSGYIAFSQQIGVPGVPAMRFLLDPDGIVPPSPITLSGQLANYGIFSIQGLTTATKQWA